MMINTWLKTTGAFYGFLLCVVLMTCFGAGTTQAQSQGKPYHPDVVTPQPQGSRISPEAAIAAAKTAQSGRVLHVSVIQRGGNPMYRIKMLNGQGRVSIVFVDANSGAVQQP